MPKNFLILHSNGDGTFTVTNAAIFEADEIVAVTDTDPQWIGWTRNADGTWVNPAQTVKGEPQ